jgi:hypothetical protein
MKLYLRNPANYQLVIEKSEAESAGIMAGLRSLGERGQYLPGSETAKEFDEGLLAGELLRQAEYSLTGRG